MASSSHSTSRHGQRALAAMRLAAPASRSLFWRLWERFGGADALLGASFSRLLAAAPRLGEAGASAIARAMENPALDRELGLAEEIGARWIALGDDEYPANLAESPCPPPILTALGVRLGPWARRSVALVGSRRSTPYGIEAARRIAFGLARADIAVASGLAVGIDTAAMLAAAEAGGRAIGVLGSGLANIYPPSAARHVDAILERGALISEYPLATPPEKERFPERNWIIAAMTLGTCVVEAAERSGTFITANCALECNRSVFAVPADIARSASQGANKLIREGAQLVARAEDILADLAPRLRQLLDEEAGGSEAGAPSRAEAGHPSPGAARVAASAATSAKEVASATPPRPVAPETPPKAAPLRGDPPPGRARLERGAFVPSSEPPAPMKAPPNPFRERPEPGERARPDRSRRDPPTTLGASPSSPPAASRTREDSAAKPAGEEPPTPLPEGLSQLQLALVVLLGATPIHRDELVRAGMELGADDGEIAMALLDLEMEGVARQLPGKHYARG